MNENNLSARYAKAFFELANEKGVADSVLKQLEMANQAFQRNPRFLGLLESPIINKSAKRQAVERLLPAAETALLKKFILVLIEKNRVGIWEHLCSDYEKLVREKNNEAEATIVTARKPDAAILSRLRATLGKATGKKIVYDVREDKNLIGGIQIRIANRLIDESLRTKLNELKLRLAAASFA